MAQRTFPEKHWQGAVGIENLALIQEMDLQCADFGVRIASNGQVWCCVNGIAFVRFRPLSPEMQKALGIKKEI